MLKINFDFIGKNPPTALIVGDILLFVISAIFYLIGQNEVASNYFAAGGTVIGVGVVLQLVWLFLKETNLFR